MKHTIILVMLLALVLAAGPPVSAEVDSGIKVLFVGGEENPRNEEFKLLLEQYFDTVEIQTYPDFYFSQAKEYDVLILDYEFRMKHIPREMPEGWSMPTILISSGDMILGRSSGAKINWL